MTFDADQRVPRVRSALFVPASRDDFLQKADSRAADAVILDLEDAVSSTSREQARVAAANWIEHRSDPRAPVVMVRINGLADDSLDADLDAVVSPNLCAVLVPKVRSADEVRQVAEALSYHEGRVGIQRGTVRIWPLVETARAVQRAAELAEASDRVAYMGGGSSQDGDLASELGFNWTAGGLETLYARSKVLVDVRAAGVPNPITGLVSTLSSAEDTEVFARQARQFGYAGMMAIHPAQVPIINRVFAPAADQLAEAREVLDTLRMAEAQGIGAVARQGRMFDRAMGRFAAAVLRDADSDAAVAQP